MKVVRRTYLKIPNLPKGEPSSVKVGFPSGKTASDIINIAIWNEFGTRGSGKVFTTTAKGGELVVGFGGPIPERPFMRNAMRKNRKKYLEAMKSSAGKILLGQVSLTTILQRLGIVASDDIKKEIVALKNPPNAPLTILIKGSSNPLVDTGRLANSPTWDLKR